MKNDERPLSRNIAKDDGFDASEFAHLLSRGVGDGRAAASSRVSSRHAVHTAAAIDAMTAFAQAARSSDRCDVIAAYLRLCPGAPHLFSALWLVTARPAAAMVALDCLQAIVDYANLHFPSKQTCPDSAVAEAKVVTRDIVKGRVSAVYETLSKTGSDVAVKVANKTLTLLTSVAQSHPLLAKEIVHRLDLSSRTLISAFCSGRADRAGASFINLVCALLTSGDHDVVFDLATRSRQSLISCLQMYTAQASTSPTAGKELSTNLSLKAADAETKTLEKLLSAIRERILRCPNRAVLRAAFENPVLGQICEIAVRVQPPDSVQNLATSLFFEIVSQGDIVSPTYIAKVLNQVEASDSQEALNLVLRAIETSPRASHYLLHNKVVVQVEPQLSSRWFAHAAIIGKCVRFLPKANTSLAKSKFFEKCWSNQHALVRHVGVLIATAFSDIVIRDKDALRSPRGYLPPLYFIETLLKKHKATDETVFLLLARYRLIFRKEFEDSRTDAIRLAKDSLHSRTVLDMVPVICVCLHVDPAMALSSLFRLGIFSDLLCSVSTTAADLLLRRILRATALFPSGTVHEIDLWISVVQRVRDANCARQFEDLLVNAWERPFALYDDLQFSDRFPATSPPSCSLVTAAALRRIDKIVRNDSTGIGTNAGFLKTLVCGLACVMLSCSSKRMQLAIGSRLQHFDSMMEDDDLDCLLPATPGVKLRSLLDPHGTALSRERPVYVVCDILDYICSRRAIDEPVARILLSAYGAASGGNNSQMIARPAYVAAAFIFYAARVCCLDSSALDRILNLSSQGERVLFSKVEIGHSTEALKFDSSIFILSSCLWHAPVSDPLRERLIHCISAIFQKFVENRRTSFAGTLIPAQVVLPFFKSRYFHVLGAKGVRNMICSLAETNNAMPQAEKLESFAFFLQNESNQVRAVARVTLHFACLRDGLCIELHALQHRSVAQLRLLVEEVPAVRDHLLKAILSSRLKNAGLSRSEVCVLSKVVLILVDQHLLNDGVLRELSAAIVPSLLTPERANDSEDDPNSLHMPSFSEELSDLFRKLLIHLPNAEYSVDKYLRSFIYDFADNATSLTALDCVLHRCLFVEPEVSSFVPESLMFQLLMRYAEIDACWKYPLSIALQGLLHLMHKVRISSRTSAAVLASAESTIRSLVLRAAPHGVLSASALNLIAVSFEMDFLLGSVAEETVAVLTGPSSLRTLASSCKQSVSFAAALGRLVLSSLTQLRHIELRQSTARGLAAFEEVLSCCEQYRGSPSADDATIASAMRVLALKLSNENYRVMHRLADRRCRLFKPCAADVIQFLEPCRLVATADLFACGVTSDPRAYDGFFVIDLLRRAATDAAESANAGLVDFGFIVRSGLLGVAMSATSVPERRLRVHAYAALAALKRAIGPIDGVPSDSSAALYKDRRQLAYLLQKLCLSIRRPLERLSPLFVTYYHVVIQIILQPTHDAYQTASRAVLRKPVENFDVNGLVDLLDDSNPRCQRLALDIIRRGLCSDEDHYVAKRRKIYEKMFALQPALMNTVIEVLIQVVNRGKAQITADLVRSQGILPWMKSIFRLVDGAKLLSLLSSVARNLPRGVLCRRYTPALVEVLESIADEKTGALANLSSTTLNIARLIPKRMDLLLLDRILGEEIPLEVYSKTRQPASEKAILRVLVACCEATGEEFPSTASEQFVGQAFVAQSILEMTKPLSPWIRHCLACLMIDPTRVTLWGLVASIAALQPEEWTNDIRELAANLPSSVSDCEVDQFVNAGRDPTGFMPPDMKGMCHILADLLSS